MLGKNVTGENELHVAVINDLTFLWQHLRGSSYFRKFHCIHTPRPAFIAQKSFMGAQKVVFSSIAHILTFLTS
jgi:hypothetical protein